MQEVEYKQILLRNIAPMRKKLEAPKICTSRLPSDGFCIGRPTTFGVSNMRFPRDEDLSA